jgi:hypothetical protein
MSEANAASIGTDGASDEVVRLYRRAFAEFRAQALWNIRQFEEPTLEQALSVARHLRVEGDMDARRLAEQIEQAARAPFQTASGHSAHSRQPA